MNHNLSPKNSPEKTKLHPSLETALSNLDINIEEELSRFQQHQKHRRGITQSSSLAPSTTELSEDTEAKENTDSNPPETYLASSEELLRSLDQEDAPHPISSATRETQKNTSSSSSWRRYLFTPLGIAGILIFVLAGTLFTLILVDIGEGRLTRSNVSPEPETNNSTEIPNRPNLAGDEFADLNENNLVEAKPREEIPAAAKPRCDGFYCVMVENPSPDEYQQTRQIAGDAYLREFPRVGRVLQVGAFDTEARAKQLQERLEQNGVSATIYLP